LEDPFQLLENSKLILAVSTSFLALTGG